MVIKSETPDIDTPPEKGHWFEAACIFLVGALIGLFACKLSTPKATPPKEQEIMTVWQDRTNWLSWTNVLLDQKSNLATLYVEAPFKASKINMRITMAQKGDSNEWAVDFLEMRMPDGWFKESTNVVK